MPMRNGNGQKAGPYSRQQPPIGSNHHSNGGTHHMPANGGANGFKMNDFSQMQMQRGMNIEKLRDTFDNVSPMWKGEGKGWTSEKPPPQAVDESAAWLLRAEAISALAEEPE